MQNLKEFYEKIYALFEETTPLGDTDCGLACDKACCGGEADEGMYLFPGEMSVYNGNEDWISIEKSEFTVNGVPVPIAICGGKCDRSKRPLSCRIFPLMFYAKRGDKNIQIKMDPRGRSMCPLVRVLGVDDLDERFVLNVTEAADILSEYNDIMEFIYEQSELVDEMPDLGNFNIDDMLDEFSWNGLVADDELHEVTEEFSDDEDELSYEWKDE